MGIVSTVSDIVTELRVEMARQRLTAASLARRIEPEDWRTYARKLRRWLRGEQDMRLSDLHRIADGLGLHLAVVTNDREDT